jgi:Mg2+ and Co2+ transporter CorA
MKPRRKKPPKSIRKYLRREKARLRRNISDIEEQEKLISQLYQKFKK